MSSSNDALDFRDGIIERRFRRIDFTLLVASGKGGVGKSLVSATLAAEAAKSGLAVGLLDLDLHGPSSAAILGVEAFPEEKEDGLVPPEAAGVKVMSVDLFVRGRPVPVCGWGKREVIKEIMALTDWGRLDLLVVDLPPGTGDEVLTAASSIRGKRGAIIVTIPSALSVKVARRAAELLMDMGIPLIGVVENMAGLRVGSEEVRPFGRGEAERLASELGIPLLGSLPIDPAASSAADASDVDSLLKSEFAAAVRRVLECIRSVMEAK